MMTGDLDLFDYKLMEEDIYTIKPFDYEFFMPEY